MTRSHSPGNTKPRNRLLVSGSALLLAAAGVLSWRSWRADPPPAIPAASMTEPSRIRPVVATRVPLTPIHAAPLEADRLDGLDVEWIEKNNRAIQCLADGELEAAIALFEECHGALPERAVFRKNLAEALLRRAVREHDERGALAGALADLARAVELAPEREDLAMLESVLARWREEAALEGEFTSTSSAYFALEYAAERSDVVKRPQDVLDALEAAYGELREWFAVDPVFDLRAGVPFRVVLYTHAEFDRVTGIGEWAGGAFDGVLRVSVEDLAQERGRWERVARHELVHAFVQEVGGLHVPGWLNEGLAQWLEWSGREESNRDTALGEARARLKKGGAFELTRLEGSLAAWTDREEIRRAYAQSLAFVGELLGRFGREELIRVVKACAAGRGVAEAFEERSAVALDVVFADWVSGL